MFEKLISFQALYRPDAIAISTPVGSATFASFDADIDRMANRLRPILSAAGRRVAVQVTASGLHWVVTLALARLGCISASLPPVGERPEAELLSILRPDVLLSDRSTLSTAFEAFHLSPEWIQQTFQAPAEPIERHAFEADDPVRIVMSSGTTGAPKKMLMTRRMVDNRIKIGGMSQLAHRRMHAAVGLDTETGFRAALVAWATGSAVLYPEAGFTWPAFLLGSRPEALALTPVQLDALLRSLPPEFPPQPQLSLVLISGSPSPALFGRAQAQLTPSVFVTYGSTEAGLAAQASPSMLARGDPATGVVSASSEVEVVDDAGRVLPLGNSGRVRVRTDEMVEGYLDDAALTQAFFKDGWFYPGDLGALASDGRLTIHGRDVEILDLGGLRIAPAAIEDVLLSSPGVRDAAAFSAPTPGGVDRARAAIVCDTYCDLGLVKSRLREALPHLAVELVVVDQIPRSERGKIQREAIQRQATPLAAL